MTEENTSNDPLQNGLAKLVATFRAPSGPDAFRQHMLARQLAFAMLDTMKGERGYNKTIPVTTEQGTVQKPLSEMLALMVDNLWPEAPRTEEQKAQTKALLASLETSADPTVRHLCSKTMVRIGHLHQLAGLLARDIFLQQTQGPSLAAKFLRDAKQLRFRSAEQAVEALGAPTIELTFTAHPTNTSNVPFMRAQRTLAMELGALSQGRGNEGALKAALKQFATTSILPTADGRLTNLTPQDEVEYMLYFLSNLYDDLPQIYGTFDTALNDAYSAAYKPEAFKLSFNFNSWGSAGDKDGNSTITADATLYGVAAHKQAILQRYLNDLNALNPSGPLAEWRNHIKEALKSTQGVMDGLSRTMRQKKRPSEAEFNQYSEQLQAAAKKVPEAEFSAALEQAYGTAEAASKPAMLTLLRRVRTFGMNFGKIEYRETSEEYTRVVGLLIPGYEAMDEGKRCAALNVLIGNPEVLKKAVVNLRATLGDAYSQSYSKTDAKPIAYQTLKRMELARDFPESITTNVLAECQNRSNLLEALLLQHAVNDGTKRAMLNIVPLFEDQRSLKAAPSIIKSALDTPAYKAHLDALPKVSGKPVQQVQLAHSDNARRAGMPAARALIFEAHDTLRQAVKGSNVELQFFEGGSQSDPYRGGVRAISSMINQYGLHKFAKMTFQGGDLLNFFNIPRSSFRFFVRNITNSAECLRAIPVPKRPGPDDVKTMKALIAGSEQYRTLFEGDDLRNFMDAIGYKEEVRAGNVSTRASARGTDDGKPVDPRAMRSISFSETLQHGGLVPTWLGAKNLKSRLPKKDAKSLRALYENSSIYRDVIDRMMFGLARSDLDNLERLSKGHPLMQTFRKEYAEAVELCIESYTGKPLKSFSQGKEMSSAEIRNLLIDTAFPHVADIFADHDGYVGLARTVKYKWTVQLPEGSNERQLQNTLSHNAFDTVHHGRFTLLDDPAYARLYCEAMNIQRPYLMGGKGR